ncbi:MAG TPA: hypothetical protein VFC46_01175, partial [Humisphaera sp.]|nr:hypothetical protein [Humisphaera sp.]
MRQPFCPLIIFVACVSWLIVSIAFARHYWDQFHDWKYEAIPIGVTPPSESEIAHLSFIGGEWIDSAIFAFVAAIGCFLWGAIFLVRWLGRRNGRSARGFEVIRLQRSDST